MLYGTIVLSLFARIRAFATRALVTRATSLLKYFRLQIFEQKRDCSQSRYSLTQLTIIELCYRKLR